ncbi:cathepsin L-like proteinase [Oppia nitens]|uniref:cathepsin L-like proteinase n=1 Tax=Oppia nitens TaxID=1686743 RepID=UPI0023D9E5D1|nr:cathepsin L-like proteinase [Oppia nitens]
MEIVQATISIGHQWLPEHQLRNNTDSRYSGKITVKLLNGNTEAKLAVVHTLYYGCFRGFTDMTSREFLAKYTTTSLMPLDFQKVRPSQLNVSVSLTDTVDWRSLGKVGPINKNQANLQISKQEISLQYQLFLETYPQRQHVNKYRESVFAENYRKIAEHNWEAERGIYTYTMGVNAFTDMTSKEFLEKFTTKMPTIDIQKLRPFQLNVSVTVPDSLDWRSLGKVGPIKNQGQCGSCWAFATVAILESRLAIKRGSYRSLSEQEIIDCTDGYTCAVGGNIQMALKTLNRLGGIEADSDYPYISGDKHKNQCAYQSVKTVAQVGTSYINVQDGESGMQQSVYMNGPLYVHVHVNENFQHYRSGVFSDQNCDQQINHAVSIVGYGPGYWLIRNSWDTWWGEQGYIRLARDQNMCRISVYPVWTDDIN